MQSDIFLSVDWQRALLGNIKSHRCTERDAQKGCTSFEWCASCLSVLHCTKCVCVSSVGIHGDSCHTEEYPWQCVTPEVCCWDSLCVTTTVTTKCICVKKDQLLNVLSRLVLFVSLDIYIHSLWNFWYQRSPSGCGSVMWVFKFTHQYWNHVISRIPELILELISSKWSRISSFFFVTLVNQPQLWYCYIS